jgi:hypothetical protein
MRLEVCQITAAGARRTTLQTTAREFYEKVRAAGWTRTPDPRDAPNEASLRFRKDETDCLFNVYQGILLGTESEIAVSNALPRERGEDMYRRSLPLIGTTVVLLVGLSTEVMGQARSMELADLGREVGLSSPAISPDGGQVVVIRSIANYEDNRFDRSLVLIDVTNGTERPLTPGRRRVSSPQWSPSGDQLAFVDTVEDEEAQIYLMPMTGGEAVRITNVERGVLSYAWRPDGGGFGFTTRDAAEQREGEERHNKSFEVGDNVYLAQSAPTSAHIWLVGTDGGEPERLTSGEWSVTGFAWAPDGQAVSYARQPRPHTGEELNGALAVLDLGTGDEREVYRGATAFGASGARFSPEEPTGRLAALRRPVGVGTRSHADERLGAASRGGLSACGSGCSRSHLLYCREPHGRRRLYW